MDVHLVDLSAPTSEPLVVEVDLSSSAWHRVLFAPVSRSAALTDLDPALNAVDSKWRRSVDALLLRLHPTMWEQLQRSERIKEVLARRFEGRPIVVVSWEREAHVVRCLVGDIPGDVDEDRLLEGCRRAETRGLLERPGVVLPASPILHYEGPSGQHYDRFIRVGTALQHVDGLDGVAFWLIPHLTGNQLVVLDSWTIFSIGLNLDRYLAVENLASLRPADIECLRSYDEPGEELVHRLRVAAERAGATSSLVLMSVSSTGSLAARLCAMCHEAGADAAKTITLFGSHREITDDVLCVVETLGSYHDAATCPLCREGVGLARVQPQSYLLEVSAVTEQTRVGKVHADPAVQFFSRYSGLGAVAVHRDQEDGARHHAIDVDIKRLTESPAFIGRLETRVDEAMTPDERGRVPSLIIVPEHSAAAVLGHHVASRSGLPLIVADEGALGRLSEENRARLLEAERILLVDDVVLSGARLQGYRYHLRAQNFLGEGGKAIDLLVGLARPRSLADLDGLKDVVHGEKHFHAVEELVLPYWGTDDCPWCVERRMMEAARSAVDTSATMAQRYADLGETRRGLVRDLFLPWPSNRDEERLVFELGPDSIFVAANEIELFVGVASAMQVLRSSGKLSEAYTSPIAQALDANYWLFGRYYDPAIKVCILRAARRHDVRLPAQDRVVSTALRDLMIKGTFSGLYGELVFAMARKQLPIVPEVVAQDGLLDQPGPDPGIRAFLRAALGLSQS